MKKIKLYICLLAVASIGVAAKGCADKKVQKTESKDDSEMVMDSKDNPVELEEVNAGAPSIQQKGTALYYQVITPGAQQVDEMGNPVNNTYVKRYVVMETKSSSPMTVISVESANTRKYTAVASKLESVGGIVDVGKVYTSNSKVDYYISNGHTAWQISLNAEGSPEREDKKINPVVLQLKQDNKIFSVTVTEEIQLASPMYY